MRFLLITISLSLSIASQAQEKSVNASSEKDDYKVFTKVELNSGPANLQHWKKYLKNAVEVPESIASLITPGEYRVKVQFIVDIHGSIGQVKVLNQAPAQLSNMALTAIKNYPGEWRPASQCGRQVKSYHEETLTFNIGNH